MQEIGFDTKNNYCTYAYYGIFYAHRARTGIMLRNIFIAYMCTVYDRWYFL